MDQAHCIRPAPRSGYRPARRMLQLAIHFRLDAPHGQ